MQLQMQFYLQKVVGGSGAWSYNCFLQRRAESRLSRSKGKFPIKQNVPVCAVLSWVIRDIMEGSV